MQKVRQSLLFLILFSFCAFNLSAQNISLVYPKFEQTVDKKLELVWNDSDSLDGFLVVVSNNSNLSNPLISRNTTRNRFKVNGITGRFYWKVFGTNNLGIVDSSALSIFNVTDIKAVDSLTLWLRSDTGLVFNGNSISSWQDLSDSSSIVSQAGTTFQPILSSDMLNGFPLVFFDNANDWMSTSAVVNSRNYYISSVYNTLNPGPNRSKQLIRGSSGWFLGNFSGFNLTFSGGFVTGRMSQAGEYVVHSSHTRNDTISNNVNGQLIGERPNSASPPMSINIGNSLTSFNVDGNLAEVVIINGLVSDSVKKSIDKYLLDRYAPPVNLGENQRVCNFPYVLNTNGNSYASYVWSTSSLDSAITVSNSGTYAVSVTDEFQRVSIDSVEITQDLNNYVVDLPRDTVLCAGDSLILTAGSELYSYSWSTGETSNEIVVDSAGSYKVTVTDCLNNSSLDSISVGYSEPVFSLGIDTTICFYDSITITPQPALSGVSYSWSNGTFMPAITVKSSNDYNLTITDQFGCNSSDTISIMSDSLLFGIDLGPDTSLCEGNVVGLINPLPNIDSYQWNTGSFDSTVTILGSQNYQLTVTEQGCSNVDSVFITVKGKAPLVNFQITDSCFNDRTTFINQTTDPSNINISQWSWDFGDSTFAVNPAPTHRYDTTGTFDVTLTATNDSACSAQITKEIKIAPNPLAAFIYEKNCLDDSVQFINRSSISSGLISNYSWKFDSGLLNDSSNSISPKVKYSAVGVKTVSLFVESNSGCLDTLDKIVFINQSPSASFFVQDTIVGDSTIITDTSSIVNGTINSRVFNLGLAGQLRNDSIVKFVYPSRNQYYISLNVISDSGCIDTSGRIVTIIPEPPRFRTTFPKDRQTLSGEGLIFKWKYLDSLTRYNIQVSDDVNFNSIILDQSARRNFFESPRLTGGNKYWRVIGTSDLGNRDTTNNSSFFVMNIKAIDSLNLWLRSDTGLVTSNDSIRSWTDLSDSLSNITQPTRRLQPKISVDSLNDYPLVRFDDIDDKLVTDVDIYSENYYISAVYNTVRLGSSSIEVIRGSSGWFLGNFSNFNLVFNGSLIQGVQADSGQFVVHSAHSVNDSTTNNVNGIEIGKNVNNRNPSRLQIGNTKIDGNIAEIIVVDGTVSETLKKGIDNYLMDKYAPPVDLGEDIQVCHFPDSFTFDFETATSVLWSTGDTSNTLRVDSVGKYYVKVVDIFNRESTDSLYVTLDTNDFQVELDFEDTTICNGSSVELYVTNNHLDYSWSTGDSVSAIRVESEGKYFVEVKNCFGSRSRDSILVTVNEPRFSLGNDTTICHNGIISIVPDSTFSNISYSWNTGENSASTLADTSGTYRLQVTDSFGCKFTDSITIDIDSTLIDITLGSDTSLCVGNRISVRNPNPNITSYSWSTGRSLPSTLVDTSGSYKVTVSNGRCAISDTIVVSIKGEAPIADFLFSDICFKDSTSFVDLSMPSVVGDTLVNWHWKFDNGDSSLLKNVKYRYSNRSSYRVMLEVETNKGCTDTISKLVQLNPLPTANFNFQNAVACSKARVFHQDSSFIGQGFISKYLWNFGDSTSLQNRSSDKNPFHTYDTLGSYLVKLRVESDLGCFDSIQKPLVVYPTPIPNFFVDGTCVGDSIQLNSQTTFPINDTLEYLWTIRLVGSSFFIDNRKDPKIKLTTAGSYDIGLRASYRVNQTSWCRSNFKDTIQIFDNPVADFTVPELCQGDSVEIQNLSSSNDSIIKYQYTLNNTDTFNIPTPAFALNTAGDFNLNLTVTDNNNCSDSISKKIIVNPLPNPEFTILNNNSGVPFGVDILNTSSGVKRFLWKFGNGDTSTSFIPKYAYQNQGEYELTLVGESSKGCADSVSQTVYALSKFIDATLSKLFLVENSLGEVEVSFQIFNSGFNVIEELVIAADINNEFEFREQYDTKINSGGTDGFSMDSRFIPDFGKKVDFVCVRILSVNNTRDSISENNEICELGFNDQVRVNLFPNPVEDFLQIQYTLPDDAEVSFHLFDGLGRLAHAGFQLDQQEGFYTSFINLSGWERGIYYYRFMVNGVEKTGKILKN